MIQDAFWGIDFKSSYEKQNIWYSPVPIIIGRRENPTLFFAWIGMIAGELLF
jgi:hypothetical protein